MVLIAKTRLLLRALTQTRLRKSPLSPARAVASPQMMKRAMCRFHLVSETAWKNFLWIAYSGLLRHYFRNIRSEGSSPASGKILFLSPSSRLRTRADASPLRSGYPAFSISLRLTNRCRKYEQVASRRREDEDSTPSENCMP